MVQYALKELKLDKILKDNKKCAVLFAKLWHLKMTSSGNRFLDRIEKNNKERQNPKPCNYRKQMVL
jgi:hypothetical protein